MSNKSPNKYVTFGLRRDRNLIDVSNPKEALNNLLNDVVNDPTGTLLSEDLDAIRGLQNTNINPTRLSELSGITVESSVIEEVEGNLVIVNRPTEPLLRLIDRLENARVITGEIPAIQGGDGLLARFIPSADINSGTKLSTGDDIFNLNTEQTVEVFWDNGYFNFPPSLDDKFNDEYGGIQWTGYFVPELRDPSIAITILTTGLFIFEIDPTETDTWETLSSIYSENRTLTTVETGSGLTQVTLEPGEIKFVAVGDFVDNDIQVSSVNLSTSVITFSGPVDISNNQLEVSKVLGNTITRSVVNLPPLEVGEQIKIRLNFWFPNNGENLSEKYLELRYIGDELRYTNLYSIKPDDTPGEFEIRQFLLDAVSPSQNNVGLNLDNKKFYLNNSLILSYSPEGLINLTAIRKQGPVNINFSETSNIITGSMESVSNGNIIVPADPANVSISSTIRIKDTIGANTRVVDNNIGATETVSVNFIEHKGFIGWYKATSSGAVVTVTLGDTANLSKGFLVITPTSNSYIKITEITNPTTFVTSSNLGLVGTQIIYVYSDRSLVDKSKDIFCNGVFGKVLSVTAAAGANTLTVDSVSGVIIGQYVQFDGSIPAETQVTDIQGNVLTISNNLLQELAASNTIVFVPQAFGGSTNREGCVIPLDTAPPFVGTAVGLSTNNRGIKSASNIPSLSITTDILSANISTNNITTTNDLTFDRKLYIKSKIVDTFRTFSVLSSSS
jgi:hypothetical protein